MSHFQLLAVPQGKKVLSLRKYSGILDIQIQMQNDDDQIDLRCLSDCPHLLNFGLSYGVVTGMCGMEFCSMLNSITFCRTDLSEVDLSTLGQLPSLTELTMDSCELAPDASLGLSESLRIVEMNSVNGLEDLRMLEEIRLTKLMINCCCIETLDGLCVEDLETLDVSENQIQDLEPLRGADKLEILVVPRNEITSVEPILKLGHLKILSLCGNSIRKDKHFKRLTAKLDRFDYCQKYKTTYCECSEDIDVLLNENEEEEEEEEDEPYLEEFYSEDDETIPEVAVQ